MVHNTQPLLLEETAEKIRGEGALEIESAFYNSKVDAWEPITEAWPFKYKFDFGQGSSLSRIVNVNAEHQALDINLSHDLVSI